MESLRFFLLHALFLTACSQSQDPEILDQHDGFDLVNKQWAINHDVSCEEQSMRVGSQQIQNWKDGSISTFVPLTGRAIHDSVGIDGSTYKVETYFGESESKSILYVFYPPESMNADFAGLPFYQLHVYSSDVPFDDEKRRAAIEMKSSPTVRGQVWRCDEIPFDLKQLRTP